MKRPADIRSDMQWTLLDAALEAVATGIFDIQIPEEEWDFRYSEPAFEPMGRSWAKSNNQAHAAFVEPIDGGEPGEYFITGCKKSCAKGKESL